MKNILAVRTDRFGEFLLNIPSFYALKSAYPGARLTLVVDPYVRDLAGCIACVDEVMTWEKKKHGLGEILKLSLELRKHKFYLCLIFNPSREWNLISFLSGIPRRIGYNHKWPFLLTEKLADEKYLGLKHEIEYNLELAGIAGANAADAVLSINIPHETMFKPLNGLDPEMLVAIHPWTSDKIKQWMPERFVGLAKKIISDMGMDVVLIGSTEDQDKSRELFAGLGSHLHDLTGKTTLLQLGAVLKGCKLLISGDSGPVHLASCLNLPVVAIFRNDIPGKTPHRWGPRSPGSAVIQKSSLNDITVEEVFMKAKEVLKR